MEAWPVRSVQLGVILLPTSSHVPDGHLRPQTKGTYEWKHHHRAFFLEACCLSAVHAIDSKVV